MLSKNRFESAFKIKKTLFVSISRPKDVPNLTWFVVLKTSLARLMLIEIFFYLFLVCLRRCFQKIKGKLIIMKNQSKSLLFNFAFLEYHYRPATIVYYSSLANHYSNRK